MRVIDAGHAPKGAACLNNAPLGKGESPRCIPQQHRPPWGRQTTGTKTMSDRPDKQTRPKKKNSGSQKRQRNKNRQLCLTEAEAADIDTRAQASGLTVSGYLRALAFGKDTPQPRAARRPPIEKQELVRLQYELRKIGGNLNQIAHHLNQGGTVSPDILSEAIASHITAARAILETLGKKEKQQ